MKKSQIGSVIVWVMVALVVIILATVGYLYLKNEMSLAINTPPDSSINQISSGSLPAIPVSNNTIKDYVFGSTAPNDLVAIKLSHQAISIESPWGLEENYKGNPDGSLGQYTFADGIRMTVTVNKMSPQDELKQSDLTPSEQTQYDSAFKFIASKIGQNFSSYDYENLLHETTQQTVDQSTTSDDKLGYSEVLILKNTTTLSSSDTVFRFTNQNGKGFIWVAPNSTIPSAIDFWGQNGWRYTFMFPAKQNITEEEVDAMAQSIKNL